MNPNTLTALATRGMAYDSETHPIQPGLTVPPIVCGSLAAVMAGGELLDKERALASAVEALRRPDIVLVTANGPFDLLVLANEMSKRGEDILPLIFAAFDAGRVYDVLTAQALDAVAGGHLEEDPRTGWPLKDLQTGKNCRYNLAVVVDLVLGRRDAKRNDTYRLRYHELEHVPIDDWPAEARQYPVDDVVNTLEVALAQCGHAARTLEHDWDQDEKCRRCGQQLTYGRAPSCIGYAPLRNLHDLANQVYTHFALTLGAAWGFRTDGDALDELEREALANNADGAPRFVDAGILIDGHQSLSVTKRLIARAYGCTDACATCSGSGKVPSAKQPKVKCRGCLGAACPMCSGTGTIDSPRRTTMINCETCDASGLALVAAVPRSDGGGIAYGRDALVESGDELLMALAHYTEGRKDLEVYIPYLRQGVDRPLTLYPNVLLKSGRTSYNDAIMLLPREGGLRRCVRSRPRTVLSSTDYQGGELVTHAQSCKWMVGYSVMADALNAGHNLHDRLGAELAGVSFDRFDQTNKFHKLCRQAAKPPNFGFPSGMGAVKLVLQQRKQGPDTAHESGPSWIKGKNKGDPPVPGYKGLRFCVLIGGESQCGRYKVTQWNNRDYPPTCRACIEVATELKRKWLATWPENGPYLKLISNMTRDGYTDIVQHVSKRVRGKCGYSDAANGYFQGLLADAAKSALRRISKECYAVRSSPLYGSRVIVFQHDENILEHPEDVASEGAERVGVIMVEELQAYCPDLAPACVAKPALMRRWYKGAEELRGPDGRLIPWEPT